jgi:hypothetical protein
MKYGRHDSEYDKIRQRAGYARPRYEFDEIDPNGMFESERVEAARADFHQRMAELDAFEAKKKEESEKRHAEFRLRVDRAIMLAEYQRFGLTPMSDNPCSLSLLLKLGWTIEQVGDKNVLVRPPLQKTRKQREDEYDADGR